MLPGGRQSMVFTFSEVGATAKKLMLTDIKVVGYQDSAYWQGKYQCPNIYLKKLMTSGATEVTYIWVDLFDEEIEGEWDGGHWEIMDGDPITKENDVEIPAGQGFFVQADNIRDCTAYSFLVNGEVIKGSYAAEMLPGGRLTLGNMMPAATKLTKVEVQGYQDSAYWQGKYQCPNIYLKKLMTSGATEITYIWVDLFDEEIEGEWDGGHWEIMDGDPITTENDVTINPGQGYFVQADQIRDCKAYTLVFPACLEK